MIFWFLICALFWTCVFVFGIVDTVRPVALVVLAVAFVTFATREEK